ncbi:MAG: Dam family site-specific DNA-(adenine-N6)-methyltransferase [Syntrophaceae bacterium]
MSTIPKKNDITIQPFLKWPGGKRWIASKVSSCIKECLRTTYYEPFLGGGAVFFFLQPINAVLSDVNCDLVNTYLQVRDNNEEVITLLKELPVNLEDYYNIRDEEPNDAIKRAARFLYLNRTAFGGIYRLNKNGKFNVPFGGGARTPEILWRDKVLEKASRALRSAKLLSCDFQSILDLAQSGDVVYCDPTYTVSHENNSFRRYNERNFSWCDQERLAKCAKAAADRGVAVMVSNAYHKCIIELYAPYRPQILSRISRVSANIDGRKMVRECVFALGPWPRLWRRHFR